MTLDSVVSPQVLNKCLILVDMKSGRFKYQSGRAGDEAKKCKSPAKSGELASMHFASITPLLLLDQY